MMQLALAYASFGWAVFPVHSIRNGKCTCGRKACTSPGKHPLTKHGFKDATTDPAIVATWWKKQPWANIAIATGIKSGRLMVIDLDCKPDKGIDGEETWRQLDEKTPDTVEVLTGGGGRHLYFTYPDNVDLKSGTNVLGPGVDIRAENGYVLVPPSLHASGKRYEWEASSDPIDGVPVAPAPLWSMNGHAKGVQPTIETINPTELLPAVKVNELRSALAFISSDDRDIWLKVGMALKSTNAGQQAYGIWTEWSQQSSKYDPRDQQKTWHSIDSSRGVSLSTIFWMAKQNGWVDPNPVVAVNTIENGVNDPVIAPIVEETVPMNLYNPPGVLKSILDYILQTAYIPQPPYALNAALSLAATVLGRRYCGETKLRTNLYIVSIGTTGSGKEHPREAIRSILDSADCDHLDGGENIASGQGLLTRVSINPSIMFQLDEFGLWMKSLQQKNSGRYNGEIMPTLMKLYTSTNTKYKGTEYANQRERPRVDLTFPCVNIHATTTGETFYSSLSSAEVVNGCLNRLLVVDTTDMPEGEERESIKDIAVPPEIIGWIEEVIKQERTRGNLKGLSDCAPIRISKSPEAHKLFVQFLRESKARRKAETNLENIYILRRMYEKADKIATICACAEDLDRLIVTKEHAEWAIQFVTYHTNRLLRLIIDRIADTPFEQSLNDFYRAITDRGERGVTVRELNRDKPFRAYPPRDRGQIVETLVKSGQISLMELKTAGRKRIAYIPVNAEEDNHHE
jgi:hypothetical protein